MPMLGLLAFTSFPKRQVRHIFGKPKKYLNAEIKMFLLSFRFRALLEVFLCTNTRCCPDMGGRKLTPRKIMKMQKRKYARSSTRKRNLPRKCFLPITIHWQPLRFAKKFSSGHTRGYDPHFRNILCKNLSGLKMGFYMLRSVIFPF